MLRSVVILPLLLATPLLARPVDDKDLVDRLVLDQNLKTFTKLIARAGLIEQLKSDGPYTIFAPNDAAFAKVPPATMDTWKKDKALLRKALSYHIVASKLLDKDFKSGPLKTLSGESLAIYVRGRVGIGTGVVLAPPTSFIVNGLKPLLTDIPASNGTIHIVSTFLTPPTKK